MREIMRRMVRESWGLIRELGYQDASLEEQYNLVISYQIMLAD